jgi:hypothetical protein
MGEMTKLIDLGVGVDIVSDSLLGYFIEMAIICERYHELENYLKSEVWKTMPLKIRNYVLRVARQSNNEKIDIIMKLYK